MNQLLDSSVTCHIAVGPQGLCFPVREVPDVFSHRSAVAARMGSFWTDEIENLADCRIALQLEDLGVVLQRIEIPYGDGLHDRWIV